MTNRKVISGLCVFLIIVVIPIFACSLRCQEIGQWRWDRDPILDNPDASALHLVGSGDMASRFDNVMVWYKADGLTFVIGTGWEIKDGVLPWERAGIIGGQGFGINDLKCDAAGIILNRLGVLIYNRIKYKIWTLNDYEYYLNRRAK